jgi:anti-sigma B factor antagonist
VGAEIDLRTQVLGNCVVIHVRGELDLATSTMLQQYLVDQLNEDHSEVVVDLTQVGFVDSTALSALIVAYHKATKLGGGLHLAGATGEARKVLDITQLDVVLDLHEDVGDAIEAALVGAEKNKAQ